MAKKYKRSVSQSQIQSQPQSAAAVQPSAKPAGSFARRNAPVELNADYSYVISDLKRIGIMSLSFVALLVILHFTLPSILQLFQH